MSSLLHLNTFFNSVHVSSNTSHVARLTSFRQDGITNGQLGYLGLIDEMAALFFPWKDPVYKGDDAAVWIAAALATIFAAFAAPVAPVAPIAASALVGAGAFLAAGANQAALNLKPQEKYAVCHAA